MPTSVRRNGVVSTAQPDPDKGNSHVMLGKRRRAGFQPGVLRLTWFIPFSFLSGFAVLYNAANMEYVRTKTLTKGTVVQVSSPKSNQRQFVVLDETISVW